MMMVLKASNRIHLAGREDPAFSSMDRVHQAQSPVNHGWGLISRKRPYQALQWPPPTHGGSAHCDDTGPTTPFEESSQLMHRPVNRTHGACNGRPLVRIRSAQSHFERPNRGCTHRISMGEWARPRLAKPRFNGLQRHGGLSSKWQMPLEMDLTQLKRVLANDRQER